jgi:hypothetical protein
MPIASVAPSRSSAAAEKWWESKKTGQIDPGARVRLLFLIIYGEKSGGFTTFVRNSDQDRPIIVSGNGTNASNQRKLSILHAESVREVLA